MRVLVTLTAYDPALPGTRTFYLTNGPLGFVTGPSETPASQAFDATLLQPLDIARKVQGIGGAPRPALGELRIANGDGAYDAWLGYAWDGRAVEVRVGPDFGAYPSAYPVRFTGTIDRLDVQRDAIVVRVRDPLAALDRPVLSNRFAGDNVAPDGLEGDESLTDRLKPRVYGFVKDIPLTLVNAAKSIYHVSDTACAQVVDVRDNGQPLGPYAPTDWTVTNATTGGVSAATDGSVIVAVFGANGVVPTVRTTTDGVTFTVQTTPLAAIGTVADNWKRNAAVAFAPTLGTQGRFCVVTSGNEIITSDDGGVTWTARTPAAAGAYIGVRWCPRRTLFLALGNTGQIHTSPDGITWTAQTSGVATALNDVAVNGPLLVAVGAGGVFRTSADGVTWTGYTLGTPYRIAAFYHNGRYFVGGGNGAGYYGSILVSEDGERWTQRIVDDPNTSVYDVFEFAAENGWLVAIYRRSILGGANVVTSRDNGATWQARRNAGAALLFAVLPFNDRWYLFGSTTTTRSGAPGTYATLAELEDDTLEPVPGSYKWIGDSTGTYVRLGTPAVGEVRADVRQGAAIGDRSPAALFEAVLTDAGYTSADWVAADFTALDIADDSECGVYVEGPETIAEVLDALARTPGAWWGVDANGDFRLVQLTAPSGSSTFSITEADVVKLERVASSDPLLGLPSTATTLRFAFGSTQALDGTATATDSAVLTTHLLAQRTEEDTQYTDGADAQAEATRRQALRGVMRQAFRAQVPLQEADGTPSAFAAVDLGAVGTLTHPRFGLSGGVLVRVLGVEPDYAKKMVTLVLWR